ncbi:MAG TPA: hypothetical protein VHV30_13665 [Polyangiaceae bacterium]|jgi:hypothetical protein|nr:hypothetical protein [Polyangiaceae bacterium]
MPSIPSAIGTDAEDVVWALQTADALWKRAERVDAIVWIRRAAQAAGDASDDDRALDLARSAAELAEWIARNPSAPGARRTPPPTPPPDPGTEDVDDLMSVSPEDLEVEEPTPVRSVPEVSIPPAPASPSISPSIPVTHSIPVSVSMSPSFPAPGTPTPSMPAPAPSPSMAPAPPSVRGPVRTAAEAHAGLLDPWAEGEAPAHAASPDDTQRSVPADLPPPEFESDEVVTSAPMVAAPPASVPGRTAEPPPPMAPKTSANMPPPPPPARTAPRGAPPPLPPEQGPAAPAKKVPVPPRPGSARDTTPPVVAPKAKVEIDAKGKVAPEAVKAVKAPVAAKPSPSPLPATKAAAEPEAAKAAPVAPKPEPAKAGPEPAKPEPTKTADVDLSQVPALSDLPDDAREQFAGAATVQTLARDDEASGFALALVLEGSVDLAATIVDAAAQRLEAGAVLRARGTIDAVAPIRLVGAAPASRVATWDEDAVTQAFRTCPWVEDDLRASGDLYQALVGITMGPLGERLDASLRSDVAGRLKLRALTEHEVIAKRGEPVPGLVVVGAGELELLDENGAPNGTRLRSGEFLFASEALRAARTPNTVRASAGGALVLMAERGATQELLMTFPPLLEIFAGM